jgi:hypothetical protein
VGGELGKARTARARMSNRNKSADDFDDDENNNNNSSSSRSSIIADG